MAAKQLSNYNSDLDKVGQTAEWQFGDKTQMQTEPEAYRMHILYCWLFAKTLMLLGGTFIQEIMLFEAR